MARIAEKLTDLIGNTPLLEAKNFAKAENLSARVIFKLESFNPLSSVKDRIGNAMILDAEKKGLLKPGYTIIEPTSGNTGIALSFAAAVYGYKIILVMPDTMSIERRALLKGLGAELVLSPGSEGMKGAIKKAEEIAAKTANSYIPGQFKNPANVAIHRETTAKEILDDTDGKIDIFVAGVGTGGTISGVGEVLKKHNPNIKVVAVEPADSAVISGGSPGPHKIQGLGAGFIPEILNTDVIDQIITVKNEDAVATAKKLGPNEGLLVGISSGAAAFAAASLAKLPENAGKIIVAILPDTGERYLSTVLYE